MVNPALLASVDALPLDQQLKLVEHINGNVAAGTHVDEADRTLIETHAADDDPAHWSSIDEFDKRIRNRL